MDLNMALKCSYIHNLCVPVAFFCPLLLGVLREKHKNVYMAFLCSLYVIGYLCVLFGESQWTIYVAIFCIGTPMGGVFGLILLFISQKKVIQLWLLQSFLLWSKDLATS